MDRAFVRCQKGLGDIKVPSETVTVVRYEQKTSTDAIPPYHQYRYICPLCENVEIKPVGEAIAGILQAAGAKLETLTITQDIGVPDPGLRDKPMETNAEKRLKEWAASTDQRWSEQDVQALFPNGIL